ncbi:23S rRNA (adenine(2030)-N(6))-methyltransferase RlmJ [Ancylobacter dichloromethanicus]|uniref:Ribosomal RNA large subunit methyltransferase J n=1 Tax=Ancylobacter dichloromethanicus TaxID=518825 RepID=A0A9W6MY99_9HYPH|nr:23S rRNA (adenine(2030)-N(6))-methyltransferase RlmJ [Ancylobacter dichloromethanicus]MBS7553797.1 23S rRNA (adenine(2030)-N(6))-methyltransferase RlmJ [Ancylobacter dichloromethanicus]GLK70903.1 ribosomal RNA large subunit methyltransferase J [Ancylobacter dichloromethanicus]
MNYRHAFHAGNFADVVKHVVLTRILAYLGRKDAAYRVIDTHAGAGLYDLAGDEARRTGEWEGGIGAVLRARFTPAVRELLAPWLEAVRAVNEAAPDDSVLAGQLRRYPGSPRLAQVLARPQDRMLFCETQPGVRAALEEAVGRDPRAKVLATDGWQALNAYLPPKERRGVVLVDPPFEEPGEFHRLAHGLAEALRRWSGGIYLLWYPIKDVRAVDGFRREIERAGIPKTLNIQFDLRTVRQADTMTGCGLIVVNPPFTLAEELRTLLGALAPVLATDGAGRARVGWLTPER